ncbi:hypothetical protein RB195_024756 [Necator americanus]|uniref:Carboxylic ester hydrolase n=1 Tax=Necator americanus TaxID=51031 RepID=A0ABR1ERM1_NECAM
MVPALKTKITQEVADGVEAEKRSRSIVITGLAELAADRSLIERQRGLEEKIANVLDALEVDCLPKVAYRLGKLNGNKPRLVKVVLPSRSHWTKALSRSHLQRRTSLSNIFVRKSMTAEERKRDYELRHEARLRNERSSTQLNKHKNCLLRTDNEDLIRTDLEIANALAEFFASNYSLKLDESCHNLPLPTTDSSAIQASQRTEALHFGEAPQLPYVCNPTTIQYQEQVRDLGLNFGGELLCVLVGGKTDMQCALYLSALILQSWALDLIYLHDGSPLFGEEVLSPNGKRLTQFLGVPFAEPPVGNLRFRKPKPKHPWRTPLNATILPNSCIQSFDTYFGDFYGSTMWNANTPMSEDCLYMNIYVPGKIDQSKRLAVLVWVYGGGFWSGTSTLDVYDGRILPVEENVVLVSMNYRVSMLGFLYLGRREAPGNMGLWDQQVALKWVHKNIDVFGGDPSRITLFGESAGAASVNMHMLSARSTPYFQRAILQSGAATAPWAIEPRDVALARTVVIYNAMKCGNMSLQNPDYDKILSCFQKADADLIRENEWAPVREFADFPWVPVVDGDFLVESAQISLRQGNFKHTQLLVGSNKDESIYFIVYQLSASEHAIEIRIRL